MAYKSKHTGSAIDEAIDAVVTNKSAWDAKQDRLVGTPGQTVVFDSQGNAAACDSIEVINDLTTGGATAALSAEMGKVLAQSPTNLLDNSDFTQPVNQRGLTVYSPATEARYTLDRWRCIKYIKVEVRNDEKGRYIHVENTGTGVNGMTQFFPPERGLKIGETYTLAAETLDGTIFAKACVVPDPDETDNVKGPYIAGASAVGLRLYTPTDARPGGSFSIMFGAGKSVDVKWVAVYKGAYTVDTLPKDRSRGYAAELRECQRYFYALSTSAAETPILYPVVRAIDEYTEADYILTPPAPMYSTPTPVYPDGMGDLAKYETLEEGLFLSVKGITLHDMFSDHSRFRIVFQSAIDPDVTSGEVIPYLAAGAFYLDANL